MIGLPQHIAIGYLRISHDCAMFEFFDPAGPTGDREGVKELKKWAEKKLPKRIGRPVQFHQVHRRVNFQHDVDDVMCQTWIWYWVYFRVVRNYPPRNVFELSAFFNWSETISNLEWLKTHKKRNSRTCD